MHRLLIAVLFLLAVTGCSGEHASGGLARTIDAAAPATAAATAAAAARGGKADGPRQTLAYEHSILIDTQEARVAPIHEAALSACRAASDDLCTVLDSHLSTGRQASASLRFRARPAGIAKLVAALGRQGDITEQSTKAEDLAGPIQDADKKLAMLTTYRAELEALRGRAGNGIDALIKLNHELAEVQSEWEAAAGVQATLLQRVQTETLDVTIRSTHGRAFWSPISLALSEFGSHLSEGVSATITATAYLLPWVVLLGVVAWIARRLWRRRQRP